MTDASQQRLIECIVRNLRYNTRQIQKLTIRCELLLLFNKNYQFRCVNCTTEKDLFRNIETNKQQLILHVIGRCWYAQWRFNWQQQLFDIISVQDFFLDQSNATTKKTKNDDNKNRRAA